MQSSLHVHISGKCQKEAEYYGLVEQIYKLKEHVLRNQSLTQFEKFEYPYRVKKYLSYQYRLLARIDEYPHQNNLYRVLSFIKIFGRKDKDYEKLWINTKEYGNHIFFQSGADIELKEFINTLLQNNQPPITPPPHLFINYRVDTLNFLQNIDTYQESPIWRYEIAPNLSALGLKESHNAISCALNQHSNQTFTLSHQQIAQQKIRFIYHNTIDCQFDSQPYIIGATQDSHPQYHRHVPLEILTKDSLWYLSQQTQLPFKLNTWQYHCVDKLFLQQQSYPFVMQGNKNAGKTTLLALLYVHFYFKYPNNTPQPALPCLFLCHRHEEHYLRQQIKYQILVYQSWYQLESNHQPSLETLLKKSCLSIESYLCQHLEYNEQVQFHQDNYLDKFTFLKLYHQDFYRNQKNKTGIYQQAHLIWQTINYLICGSSYDTSNYQPNKESIIDKQTFATIYENIYQNWYLPIKQRNNLWDIHDLMAYIEQNNVLLTPYLTLLCDDGHLLPENVISTILKQSFYLNQSNHPPLSEIPLIFSTTTNCLEKISPWQTKIYQEIAYILETNQNTPYHHHLIGVYHGQQKQYSYAELFFDKNKQTQPNQLPNIFFVLPSDSHIVPLLQQQHIPLIVNDTTDDINTVLSQKTPLIHRYFLPNSNLPKSLCSISKPAPKNNAVALLGFESLLPPIKNTHQTDTQTQHHLSCQLDVLFFAFHQATTDVFIIARQLEEQSLWEHFFAAIGGKITIASQHQLNVYAKPHQQQHVLPIKTFYDYVLTIKNRQKITTNELNKHIDFYDNLFDVNKKVQYQAILFYQQQRIDEFFVLYHHDEHIEIMITLLLLLHDHHHLYQYKEYIAEKFLSAFICLQLLNDIMPPQTWTTNYVLMSQQTQPIHDFWRDFWTDCYQKLATIIKQYSLTKDDYQTIYQATQNIIDQGDIYPFDFLAYLHFKLTNYYQAIEIWDNAYNHYLIDSYPTEYHQSQIQCLVDFDEKLNYIFGFDLDFIIQELSTMNLNEMQETYWQKILAHLYEEKELEQVLKHLLPHITSQDVLEKIYQFCQNIDDMNEENFAHRIQRFKTLQLCLYGDWQSIQSRIQFYQPTSDDFLVLQKKLSGAFNITLKNGKKPRYSLPEEIMDIIYGLCNNSQIHELSKEENFADYQNNAPIVALFQEIKNFFSIEHQEEVFWRTNFNSIKSLCHLMEKSPDLSMPLSLYLYLLAKASSKDTLYTFYKERLWAILQKIDRLNIDDEKLIQKATLAQKNYKKILQNLNTNTITPQLPPLKTTSELMLSILKLTNSEHTIIQKLRREEQAAQKTLELKQERLEQERLEQEQTHLKSSDSSAPCQMTPRQATSEFVLFGLRIFVSRTHKRLNIEDTYTGERWSLHHPNQAIQSDWDYTIQDGQYVLLHLHLVINVLDDGVYLWQSEHGVGIHVVF
ncbi:MAG: hypothetical protein Q4A69_04745 [Moraxella sp.]|nr:hypothetical protein [Moraxella sp.]